MLINKLICTPENEGYTGICLMVHLHTKTD